MSNDRREIIAEGPVAHTGRQIPSADSRTPDGYGKLYAAGAETRPVFDHPADR